MLILLPPSEGKRAPEAGDPVDLAALSFPELTAKRERALSTLVRVAGGAQRGRALKALGLSKGQAGELERDAALPAAPAAPAAGVYSGVLYERLGLADLPHDRVLIASALWGMLRPGDRIPAYKLSMDARLPRIGPLAAFWRPALRRALPDGGLVVDLRSGAYAAAWTPAGAERIGVRAFAERPDGTRATISHNVKAARGDVARALLSAPEPPDSAQAVAEIAGAAGLEVELSGAPGGWSLDVIERG